MPRRSVRLVAPVWVSVVLAFILSACLSQADTPAPDPLNLTETVPNETLVPPNETLPPLDKRPMATAEAIKNDVLSTLGVEMPVGASECIVGGILDAVAEDELNEFGPNGALADAPESFRNRALGAFDDCIDGATLALAGAPILVAAGLTDTKATCFFRLVRENLGIVGFYRYSAARDGTLDPDVNLTQTMSSITQRCGIDPASLKPTTAPAPLNEPVGEPTTSLAATTSS